MIQLKRLLAIAAAVALTSLAGSTAHAQITYSVLPFDLGNGYAIDGGSITTNGFLGTTSDEAVITDYEFLVSGPLPQVFTPTTDGASLLLDGLQFSEEEVFIDAAGASEFALFRINALDNTSADCDTCQQTLGFTQNGFSDETTLDYEFTQFRAGGDPPDPDGGSELVLSPQTVRLVIATAVPEPSSAGLLAMASLGVAARRVRRRS